LVNLGHHIRTGLQIVCHTTLYINHMGVHLVTVATPRRSFEHLRLAANAGTLRTTATSTALPLSTRTTGPNQLIFCVHHISTRYIFYQSSSKQLKHYASCL